MAGYHFPHLLNVETAAKIKQGVSLPVSVVGGITTIDEAEAILAAGKADIVAMAKALIADQDLVTKARLGEADEIRPCLRCLECAYGGLIGTPLRCAVNPQAGREVKYREIPLARRKKRVLVIGGGPAGMTAARTACERGHDVTLWEKSDRLGGRLYEAAALPQKDTARAYIDWAIRSTMKCGATVVLGKEATPAAIEAEAPDAVIVAVGAEFATAADRRDRSASRHDRLGGRPGHEARRARTWWSAAAVSPARNAPPDWPWRARRSRWWTSCPRKPCARTPSISSGSPCSTLMKDKGIERVQGSVRAITATGVVVTLPDGTETAELPADTVVIAFGLRPDPIGCRASARRGSGELLGRRLPQRRQDLHSQPRRVQRGRGGMTCDASRSSRDWTAPHDMITTYIDCSTAETGVTHWRGPRATGRR